MRTWILESGVIVRSFSSFFVVFPGVHLGLKMVGVTVAMVVISTSSSFFDMLTSVGVDVEDTDALTLKTVVPSSLPG